MFVASIVDSVSIMCLIIRDTLRRMIIAKILSSYQVTVSSIFFIPLIDLIFYDARVVHYSLLKHCLVNGSDKNTFFC